CNRPICGSARSTISPSSSRINRSTPCAAGCCGPKLIEWLSISTVCVLVPGSITAVSLILSVLRPRRLDFFVTRQGRDGFPWRHEIEIPEILGQLHRLVDHGLAILVVTHLDITGQRKILAQRMSLEAVIGQDAAQIRLAGEDDAIQVPGLTFPPGRGGPDTVHRRDR